MTASSMHQGMLAAFCRAANNQRQAIMAVFPPTKLA
jgi:hypothetical protein